jgi:hypothetical protein
MSAVIRPTRAIATTQTSSAANERVVQLADRPATPRRR